MIATRAKSFLGVFLSSLLLAACKTVAPNSPMPIGVDVPPPAAYETLCAKSPKECMLPMTPETEDVLQQANKVVQSIVVPTEETEGDVWQILSRVGAGDCEDFALTLRKALRQSLPEFGAAFRMATAFTELDQYHAVLTVETTEGTLVCDIRFAACQPWQRLPYTWHLREVAGQRHWEDIGSHETQAKLAAASIR